MADEQAAPLAGDGTEQTTTPAVAATLIPAAEKPTAAAPETEVMTLAEAQKLRREAQRLRDRIKTLEGYESQAEETAREQGKWQELAQKYEPLAKEAQDLRETVQEIVEAELAAVPGKFKPLIPEFDSPRKTLAWLRSAKAAGMFAPPVAPNTGAGEGAKGEKPAAIPGGLTPQEFAAIYGVNPQYVR